MTVSTASASLGPAPVAVQAAERSGERTGFSFTIATLSTAHAVSGQWAALAERASDDNAFFHPDIAIPAMLHFGHEVAVATVGTGSRLVAATPFVRRRLGGIAPAVSLWIHPYGPLGTPLVAADALDEAVAALVEGLAPRDRGGSLIVPDLPLGSNVAAALMHHAKATKRPAVVLSQHRRAVLERSADPTSDTRTPKRRKEHRRQMRRLADIGHVTVESTTDCDRVCARFEEFLALEAAGWKGRAGTALADSFATAEFARDAVFSRAAAGGVRIDSIRLDAHPIAILVSFVGGATAFTWKITYDEAYARFSPGAQLMLEAAAGLLDDPTIDRIDSCAASDHPMIDHLWPGRMTMGTLVVGPPGGGLVFSLGVAAARAEIAARDRAKYLRDRLT